MDDSIMPCMNMKVFIDLKSEDRNQCIKKSCNKLNSDKNIGIQSEESPFKEKAEKDKDKFVKKLKPKNKSRNKNKTEEYVLITEASQKKCQTTQQ